MALGQVVTKIVGHVDAVSYQFLASSHWFPLVGCGVPVDLIDGSMKPSLAYV